MKIQNISHMLFLTLLFPVLVASSCESEDETKPLPPSLIQISGEAYFSTADEVAKFEKQDENAMLSISDESLQTINVDINNTYQSVDGFGLTLTGGSAKLLSEMSDANQNLILNELFGVDAENIGLSYLRISVGSSDLDEYTFSYNATDGDVDMENFDLGYDHKYLIPMLKKIKAINPEIKIMATPWSPPIWMKTVNSTIGGSLKPEYYTAYANYLARYIEEMLNEGIVIDLLTVQNEPLHDGNNPSLLMPSDEQLAFIKESLGPTFESLNIATGIVIYDHNCDKPEYPISILDDEVVNKYIDGSAFHLYAGDISSLSTVHNAHPDKNIYFTEQWVGAPGNFEEDIKWHMREVMIGSMRNWSKIAMQWNLAADSNLEPHTEGGCDQCLGALTIDANNVQRNPAYYILAHFSKFVRPNSQRVESNNISELQNVAFINPNNELVVVVLNDSDTNQTFNIEYKDTGFTSTLTAGAVGTYVVEI